MKKHPLKQSETRFFIFLENRLKKISFYENFFVDNIPT